MKKTNFIIPLEIYPYDVMFSFGESNKDLRKTLSDLNVDEEDISLAMFDKKEKIGGGICVKFNRNKTLIRLVKYPESCLDYGQLSHEIFHAVSFVMDTIGMPLKIGVSDEGYAYLIQYLTKEVYKRL